MSVGCRFLICNASRIWSFCLLFWCSNIVVLSVRIFRSCVVGHECFFKCWAIELVSERCIVSLLDRVVEVKPYICWLYIYTYFFKKKQRNQSQRIINLFPSCYAFLKFPKTRKKINRTSSDLLDLKSMLCIIGTLSSLPGKSKYSFMNNFLSWWNYSQLRFNWTKYTIYIYIYIYIGGVKV